ncbi:hypothetical protein [Caldalkalibacillus mannanilyticus]|uniref:hypothetical protein n=1 Tax=Caldalkalibacillus mannanilyticus TaxID=1418 RepID=UPI0004698C98|nr:hypothetical protein [Caldalkalibacillus mannanilyticus]
MDLRTLIVSIFEWIALLSFPLVLLGYHYRRYIRPVFIIAFSMSLFSELLRLTPMHVALIIAIQIIVLLVLVKVLYRAKNLETVVVTSIGYGFYIFIQMLFIEIVAQTFQYKYLQFFTTIHIKTVTQVLTFLFVALLSWLIYYQKYQLDELRYHITRSTMNKKYRDVLVLNSFLTFIFIVFIFFTMLAEEFAYKYTFILMIIIIMFFILAIFIILHTQFQMKRLIEAKKFYLDQEEQVATIVENLKKNYQGHFQAIIKLNERESSSLSKEYVEKHHLHQGICPSLLQSNLRTGLEGLDELLYSFLINKRKLGRLLGVTINVTSDIQCEIHTTLQHVRNLSLIIDDLILIYYQAPAYSTKTIHFHVEAKPHETLYVISGDIEIEEKKHPNLKLFDALFQFKQHDSIVDSELKPVRISIRCPLT